MGITTYDKVLAKVTLASGISSTDTSITLLTGDGDKLPATGTEYHLTLWNATDYSDPADDPNAERVLVISRSGDVLTVTRGEEGTTAVAHNTAGKTYRAILAPGVDFFTAFRASSDGKLFTYIWNPLVVPTTTGAGETILMPTIDNLPVTCAMVLGFGNVAAFRTPTTWEYWDGAAWTSFTAPSNAGRMTSRGAGSVTISPPSAEKIRFVIDTGIAHGLRGGLFLLKGRRSDNGLWEAGLEGSSDGVNYTTIIDSAAYLVGTGTPPSRYVIPYLPLANYRYARVQISTSTGFSGSFTIEEFGLFNIWHTFQSHFPFSWDENGKLYLGPSNTTTQDTNLYRAAADCLKTDDDFSVGSNLTMSASGFLEGAQITDPAAPASNKGRLYFRDNGAGKTQLVVRFPTGAVQVIATEP